MKKKLDRGGARGTYTRTAFTNSEQNFKWLKLDCRGVLVLLVSVQILVRLDCFSHSITMEVWKPAQWKTAKFQRNEHTPDINFLFLRSFYFKRRRQPESSSDYHWSPRQSIGGVFEPLLIPCPSLRDIFDRFSLPRPLISRKGVLFMDVTAEKLVFFKLGTATNLNLSFPGGVFIKAANSKSPISNFSFQKCLE